MPPRKQALNQEQRTQRQISAMGDSVDLIDRLIVNNQHTEQVHNTIDRNVRHLEIMLDKDHIKNSGSNLVPFQTAITNGNDFIAVGIATV